MRPLPTEAGLATKNRLIVQTTHEEQIAASYLPEDTMSTIRSTLHFEAPVAVPEVPTTRTATGGQRQPIPVEFLELRTILNASPETWFKIATIDRTERKQAARDTNWLTEMLNRRLPRRTYKVSVRSNNGKMDVYAKRNFDL